MGDRLAIVGGDAAGMSAATNALRRDDTLEVVAFERGAYTSYSACGIPYYVGGLVEDLERLVTRSPEKHRADGIDVRIETEVVEIDLDRRELTLAGGRREPFDQLVLATGARATLPPIPGADATEPARTLDAAQRFRGQVERGGHDAGVPGAGAAATPPSSWARATSGSRWPRRSSSGGCMSRSSTRPTRSSPCSTPTWA